MLAKEVVDGCPLLEERGDFRARCVVRFQTLLEPIDVLLEVVEEVLDVDFPVRSAEDLVLEIAVEGVVELVACVLEARDERFDVTVREAILREAVVRSTGSCGGGVFMVEPRACARRLRNSTATARP